MTRLARTSAHLIAFAAVVFMQGCSSNQKISAVATETKRWTDQGWSYLETFGIAADDGIYVSHLSSLTAQTVTAFASSGGVSTQKTYAQKDSLYLIVSMQRDPTGDSFALIFTKKKP